MYRISVEGHFDAAHYLRDYHGKCENVHGHRFRVVVTLKANKLDGIGLAYDFTELKKHLFEVLAQFDHACINDVPPFDKLNASSENIAATVYEQLKGRFPAGVMLESVQVWESPQSCITYSPE